MRGDVCSDESDEGQRCKSTLPLILILNAPVSFDFPSLLHPSASPPSRPLPNPSLLNFKKIPKKLVRQIRVLLLSILHSTLLTLPFVLLSTPQVPLTSNCSK